MRRWTALVLAGALTLGSALPALAGDEKKDHDHKKDHKTRFEMQFRDWETGFWGNESLARMAAKGVIKGNADGTVAASRPVSRLEAAIMLSRLLDLEAPEIPRGKFELKAPWGKIEIKNEGDEFEIEIKTREGKWEFEDDGDLPAWGREAVLIGLRHGFLLFDGARLSPMAPLNRLEAAIMLVKAAGLDEEAQNRAGADLEFTDANRIPERLRGYIAIAVERGFVNGYDDGSFKPATLVTRAEWAALLDRLDRQGPDVSPDGRQIRGSVTAVHIGDSPAVTMTTPVFPNGVTYPVDDAAALYKNGRAITLADIVAGDNVIINLNADREIVMLSVHNVSRRVNGTVSAYTAPVSTSPGSISVTAADGATTAYVVTAQTAVTIGNQAGTLADVLLNDQVTLRVEGSQAVSIMIRRTGDDGQAVDPAKRFKLWGRLVSLDTTAGTITVLDWGNREHSLKLATNVKLDADDDDFQLSDLQPGDPVVVWGMGDIVAEIEVKD